MSARRTLGLVLALSIAAAPAFGQTGQPAPSPGDYYELGDYGYFDPAPAPPPAARPTAPSATITPPASTRSTSTSTVPAQNQRATSSAQAAPIAPGDLAAARAAAKELATEGRRGAAAIPATPSIATTVPGYSATPPPQAALFDDPDALVSQGTAASVSSVPYQTVIDPDRTRVTVDRDAIARALAVEDDPKSFLDGEALASGTGTCRPLPPSTAGQDTYEATCNEGLKIERADRSCRIPLVVTVEAETRWRYSCETMFDRGRRNAGRLCTPFQAHIDSGVCRVDGSERIGQTCLQWGTNGCVEPGDPIDLLDLSCSQTISGRAGTEYREGRVTGERRDEATCQAATAGLTCTTTSETCVDAAPETRMIDGVAVTRSCWAWERTLSCHQTSAATDCADLEARPSCTFVREVCLDDPQDGPCKVKERVFRCPVPGGQTAGGPEFICGDDVYCINGDCEPIVREASTEFKDALVGLHTLGQANAEFDEATLTLFSGTRESCHKPVFGLVNCCAGKTSGALSAASGLAALAGGPGAIAALATPFLSYFMCSTKEMMLDIKDRMGFCHKVGTWCSDSFLGICTSKRTAYCCFESKLSRILQEQGRPQLGKGWGEPKKEQCKGFSVDQFARLDLSRMDFREVYAEFIDAAKLPDELATARAIQERIEAYYRAHGPK